MFKFISRPSNAIQLIGTATSICILFFMGSYFYIFNLLSEQEELLKGSSSIPTEQINFILNENRHYLSEFSPMIALTLATLALSFNILSVYIKHKKFVTYTFKKIESKNKINCYSAIVCNESDSNIIIHNAYLKGLDNQFTPLQPLGFSFPIELASFKIQSLKLTNKQSKSIEINPRKCRIVLSTNTGKLKCHEAQSPWQPK